MSLTHDDVFSILKIIDESPYDEVRLEIGDLKLHVRRHGDGSPMSGAQTAPDVPPAPSVRDRSAGEAPASATAAAAPPPRTPAAVQPTAEGLVTVTAPMLGTFYRAPAPGEPPFVEVGTKVGANDTVCLVEVMKLFNSVKAGVAGTVAKILVDNGSMVEHGQILILIEPDQSTTNVPIQ